MSSIPSSDTPTTERPDVTAEDEDVQTRPKQAPVRIVRTHPMIRWLLLPLVFGALIMTLLFVARTQMVLGPVIGKFIKAQANKRNMDLFIQDVRPKGFLGVRLTNVRARLHRGPYILDAKLKAIDINPDILASLQQGSPVPGTIHLNEGAITLIRRGDAKTTIPSKSNKKVSNNGLDTLRIIGHDLKVQLQAGRSFRSTRPLEMKRVEASIAWKIDPLPQTVQAYGHLPDGTPFALATKKGDSNQETTESSRIFVLKPQSKTRIDRWFKDQLPFEMSVNQIEVCAGCARDEMRFDQVWLKLPTFGKGLDVAASNAKVQWNQGKAKLLLPGVKITDLDKKVESVQLTQTQFEFNTKTGAHSGEIKLKASSGGILDVTWLWDGPQRVLSGTLMAQHFSLKPFFALWGTNPFFHQGTLHGTVDGTLDLNHHLLHTTTKMAIEDAVGSWPRLASEPIVLKKAHLRSESIVDIKSRSINLLNADLSLGNAKPITLHGRVQDANKGIVFALDMDASQVNAQKFRQAMPVALTRGIGNTTFGGVFGLKLHVSGHTAFSESLKFDFNFQGDVHVKQDALNVAALGLPGAPSWPKDKFTPPLDMKKWVTLESLPPQIAKTLTAAEDAQFYRHAGFDPLGFERAMVHNLRVGRMERGGSTITQQVVKNVFLSRKRTIARKIQEAYLTWHIENKLSKGRILELYINIAEWGPNVRGLGQASQFYFGKNVEDLEVQHMALLGTLLPGPKMFGKRIKQGLLPSSRLTKFEHILSNLRFLGVIENETYGKWMKNAKEGNVAGLSLKICADDDTAPKKTSRCQDEAKGK